MAQRRMFSKSITNSSQFLMMPQSSQNLYFHLGMNADDDGFCEVFSVMRMTDSKPDDLKVLQAKGFVKVFDDRVLVIIDWKENNYLRSDRYTPSKYLEIYREELALISQKSSMDTNGIPDGNQMATQDRIGKDRIGKDILAETSSAEVVSIIDNFSFNPSYKKWYGNKTQREAIKRMLNIYGLDVLLKAVKLLPKVNGKQYFPTITTPLQLEDKWSSLEIAFKRYKNEEKNYVI